MATTPEPAQPSRGRTAETAVSVLLFLPAFGAALGLALALFEKVILYYSASDVSPEIYGLLFGALAGAGLAAGIAAAALAVSALAAKAAARLVLAVFGAVLVGGAVQFFFAFHPELFGADAKPFIGAAPLGRGLAGVTAAVLSFLVTFRSRRPVTLLLVAASAFLSGAAFALCFPPEGVLNAVSLPLLLFFAAVLLVEGALKRSAAFIAPALIVIFPAAFWAYSARTGIAPAQVIETRAADDPAKAAAIAGRPNVIIVMLDTLRRDHVGCMGYPRNTTPEIDSFARNATLYTRAKSVSSWTLEAHGSLFTGLWPRSNGAHFAEKVLFADAGSDVRSIAYPLSPNVPALAELLQREGYATAAIASNYAWLAPDFGLQRGFDYYFAVARYRQATVGKREPAPASLALDTLMSHIDQWREANRNELKPYYRAPEITDKALSWLSARRGRPFFLFLNYWDPHSPYNPPPPYDTMFPGKTSPRGEKVDWLERSFEVMTGVKDLDPARREELVSQYDGQVAYMDGHVGRFIAGVKSLGLYDDTIVVLVSDHGESFGEHRFLEHGVCLYEDEAAIFLAVKSAGQAAAASVDAPVQILDVMPTILAELRIPAPPRIDGRPLDAVTHPIVTELYPHLGRIEAYGERFNRRLTAIYDGSMKLIVSNPGGVELYDLANDPGEEHSLSDAASAGALRDALAAWDAAHKPMPQSAAPRLDEAALERLRSVNYLH